MQPPVGAARDAASDDLYRTLVEGASDAIFVADASGRHVFVNESACQLSGYTRDELRALSIVDLVPPEHVSSALLALAHMEVDQPATAEITLLRKDGARIAVELRARKLADGRVFSFVRDIGERVQTARALRESEQLLRELGAHMPSLLWVRDARSGALLYANERWTALLGREPVIGEHYRQLFAPVHPDDLARVQAVTDRVLEGGYDELVRATDEYGRLRWFQMRAFVVRDASGAPHRVAGLAEDVTERRDAIEALRTSETKYRNLFENAPVGIFRSGLGDEGFLDVNRKLCELLEGSREELLGRSPAAVWNSPEQRGEMLRELREKGATQIEAQVKTLRGGVRDLLMAAAVYPEHGYLEGTVTDLTERKRAERALADSEARHRSVVQAMSDGILVYGADGSIVTVNEAAERILGLSADQMAGRVPLDPSWRAVRADGSPFPENERPGWVTLETGEPQTGVVMGIHKPGGTLTWISVASRRITPLGVGGRYSVVASFTDITEQRRADERVRASLQEKEVLLREIHHRVKNNLQLVSSLLYLQASRSGDPVLGRMLKESQNRVASMALVHRRLYESRDLAQIPFESYVRDLARSLYHSYGVTSDRVDLEIAASDIVLKLGTALPCGLILNELLSNALKHAYPGDAHGVISVELSAEGADHRLFMRDDGVGLPEDFEARARTSLGTKLVERLVAQLGGTMVRTSTDLGTSYEITFPRDPAP